MRRVWMFCRGCRCEIDWRDFATDCRGSLWCAACWNRAVREIEPDRVGTVFPEGEDVAEEKGILNDGEPVHGE